MKDIQQLIKKNSQEGRYEDIFPKTFIDAVLDKESGVTLTDILAMFNMLFLSYNGSRSQTRLQVPSSLRREGLWITYVLYDKTVVTEWYSAEAIDDTTFGDSANWRDGSNALVGDISISSDGYWVINGEVTNIKAQGEAGITPILRVGSNNHLQVSYTNGSTYVDVSDYIAAWFRFTGTAGSSQADNVGKIQISRDNGATWSDLSGEFTNSLHIKGYVATVDALPSSAVQGDIYGVGPTYDPSDTEQTNPIYQLYVKDSTEWINNGRFTSISAGVVQGLGNSETAVISQKGVTDLLNNKSQWGIVPQNILKVNYSSDYSATLDVAAGANFYVMWGLGQYKTTQSSVAQHESITNISGAWAVFYNLTTNLFELHTYSDFASLDIKEYLIISLFNYGDIIQSLGGLYFNNKLHLSDSYNQSLSKSNYGILSESGVIDISISTTVLNITVTIKSGMWFVLYGNCQYETINNSQDVIIQKSNTVGGVWWVVYNFSTRAFEVYTYRERFNVPYNALIIAEFNNRVLLNTLSSISVNGEILPTVKNYNDRLELSIAAYDNFSINLNSFPNVTLTTSGREVYILTNKREVLFKNMIDAEVTKNVSTGDWKLWWIVYEPTANIYNIYTRGELIANLIPNDALTIAVFREKTLLYSLSNFFIDGYTTNSQALSVQNSKDIEGLRAIISGTTASSNYQFKDIGINEFQKPDADINLILVYGQSLAAGAQTCPPLSITNYKGNLMLGEFEWTSYTGNNMNALNPMYARCITYTQEEAETTTKSDQALAESPGINFVNASKKLLDDYVINVVDRKFMIVNAAVGGLSIELLSKDCPNASAIYYAKMITALNKAKQLADTAGKTIKCCGIVWMQGEWNGRAYANQGWTTGTNATNNKNDYKALLIGGTTTDNVQHNGLVNDLSLDIKSIFGQTDSPIFIETQTAINTNQTFDMPIDMALLEASHENNQVFLAGSSYMVPNRGTHLDPNGSRWMGEFFAKVYYHVMYRGKKWEPLQPVYIRKGSDNIHIGFNLVNSPLQFNTNQLQSIANYGFQVRDGGSVKTINGVAISGNEIILTFGSNLTGDVEIAYAPNTIEYGNLCDSDTWNSFEKYKELPPQLKPTREPLGPDGLVLYGKHYPMNNFSVKFYYKMSANQDYLAINI